MPDAMRKKVARAIYTEFIPAIERFEGSTKKEWDDLDPDEHAIYLACWMQMARAAMKAMREPTQHMANAGWSAIAGHADDPQGAAWPIFNAMIDAALDEKEPTDA